jgi:hypothetical protein
MNIYGDPKCHFHARGGCSALPSSKTLRPKSHGRMIPTLANYPDLCSPVHPLGPNLSEACFAGTPPPLLIAGPHGECLVKQPSERAGVSTGGTARKVVKRTPRPRWRGRALAGLPGRGESGHWQERISLGCRRTTCISGAGGMSRPAVCSCQKPFVAHV